ncbi:unnamed protein product [Rhizophagus irregularis]|nr:unnamed protein product [Rhizophagus irregularis]
MVMSLNCLLLGKTSFDDAFTVIVAEIMILCPDIMKFWKVDIAESEEDTLKEFKEVNIVAEPLRSNHV